VGDFIAQDEEFIEEVLQLVGFLQAAFDDGFPGGLAPGTVGFLLNAAHPGEGLFLAVELDGHAAADLLVLLGELRDLGFAHDVFLAIKFHLGFDAAAINRVEGRQLRKPRGLRELLHERELARLEPRIDDLNDVHVGLLPGLVIGLAGHGDVGEGRRLGQRGADFAVIAQPRFEVGDGCGLVELGVQLVEDRCELRGIGQVNRFGQELARGKMRRLHPPKMAEKWLRPRDQLRGTLASCSL